MLPPPILSAEQTLLRDSVQRWVSEQYGFERRGAIIATEAGHDPAIWREFATLGWLGLPFDEAQGGSAGSMVDLALLMQEFGRGLVVEPFLSTVVLGGTALRAAGDADPAARLLPAMIEGNLQVALGYAEPDSGYDADDVTTRAVRDGGGWRLSGHKAVVLGAPSADLLIVSARSAGGRRDPQGIGLFLVPADRPGLRLRSYQTIDGRRAAEVLLDEVRVDAAGVLGAPGAGGPILHEALLAGTVAACAEAVGAMEGAIERTGEYLNTREQFGSKLAQFQALRHRFADMFVLKQETRALTMVAARTFAEGSGDERSEAAAAAKAYVGEAGRRVGEEAVQLHGAIAIADEYSVGHYLKRLIAIDRMFGDGSVHLDRFMRLSRGLAAGERTP